MLSQKGDYVMKSYTFTYKNVCILFCPDMVVTVKTTNEDLTPEQVFRKYMMKMHRKDYMSGIIRLVSVQ